MDRQTRLLIGLVAVLLVLVALDRWWEPVDPLGNPDATAAVWSVDEDEVTRVVARRDDGAEIILQLDEDGWQVEAPFVGRANQRVATRLMRVLGEFEKGEPIDVEDPEPFGLGATPRATIDVTLADGAVQHIDMGRAAPSGWRTYVRGAEGITVIDGELETSIFVESNDLRDRHLLRYDASLVRSVTLEAEVGTLRIHGQDRDWWVEGFSRADLDAVESIVAGLLDLQAETLLEDAFPEGLPDPERVVAVGFEDGSSTVIRIGAATPVGQLIEVEGGMTGALTPDALAFLGQGPTDVADAAAVPIRQVRPQSIAVELGDASWKVELGEKGWSRDGTEDRAAFEAVETLRNVPARHEMTPAPALTEQWGAITMIGEEGTERVIRLGQLDGDFRVAQDSAGGEPYRVAVAALEHAAAAL